MTRIDDEKKQRKIMFIVMQNRFTYHAEAFRCKQVVCVLFSLKCKKKQVKGYLWVR